MINFAGCKGIDLLRADHLSKESYRLYKEDYKTEEESRAQQRAVEPLLNERKGLSRFDSHTDKKFFLLRLSKPLSDSPGLPFNIWLLGIT
jgi:hypothetical protein